MTTMRMAKIVSTRVQYSVVQVVDLESKYSLLHQTLMNLGWTSFQVRIFFYYLETYWGYIFSTTTARLQREPRIVWSMFTCGWQGTCKYYHSDIVMKAVHQAVAIEQCTLDIEQWLSNCVESLLSSEQNFQLSRLVDYDVQLVEVCLSLDISCPCKCTCMCLCKVCVCKYVISANMSYLCVCCRQFYRMGEGIYVK